MSRNNYDEIDAIVKIKQERRKRRIAVYTGDYVDISLDYDEYKNYRKSTILLISIIAILHIGAGFLNNPGMFEAFVAIPYVSAFFSLVYFFLILFQLPKEKDKFRLGEVELIFHRMRIASIFLGISLVVGILGEINFILSVFDGDQLALDIIFLTVEVIGLAMAYFLMRTQNRIIKKISIE